MELFLLIVLCAFVLLLSRRKPSRRRGVKPAVSAPPARAKPRATPPKRRSAQSGLAPSRADDSNASLASDKTDNAAEIEVRIAKARRKLGTQISGKAYVIDGDTIDIRGDRLRLFGIDAPEMDHPYGRKSKSAMIALCKGKTIHAVVTDVDDYGRLVAKCTRADGMDLSAELVRQGLALDWPKFSGGVYAHLEAADARKRMWRAAIRQGKSGAEAARQAKAVAQSISVTEGRESAAAEASVAFSQGDADPTVLCSDRGTSPEPIVTSAEDHFAETAKSEAPQCSDSQASAAPAASGAARLPERSRV